MDEPVVERRVDLEASADEVWSALSEPGRLSSWVGGEVTELDLRPGGRGTVRRADGAVRRLVVEVVEPRRRLALRWWPFEDAVAPAAAGAGTTVEFLLEEGEQGTKLTVVERPPLAGVGGARASLFGVDGTNRFGRAAGVDDALSSPSSNLRAMAR